MNALPERRRMAYGRTHSSVYRPESYAPITRYHRTEWRATLVMVALAVGVVAAVIAGVM